MVSIAQLAKFALLLFLQLPTYEASAADHEFCGPTYFSKVEGECVPCQQKCSHGQGLTQNCGLYKGEPACKDCLANHYSKLEHVAKNHEGHYICKPCKQCGDRRRKDGKQFNRTCSRFADAVCMDCPPGYYDGAQHGGEVGCFKCGPCCSSSPDERSQCKQMGLGTMCSCPERTWHQCPQRNLNVCQAKINALTGGKQTTTAFHSLTTQPTTITTTTTKMPTTASTTPINMPASTTIRPMKPKRDSDYSAFTKHPTTKSSPTTAFVSKINTSLRQNKNLIPSKTKAANSTVLKHNANHSTHSNATNEQLNARPAFSFGNTETVTPQYTIHSKYQLKERFYLGATSSVAAVVFILILVILIIKCKNKHNKHRPCDHSEVSILSTESPSVEVTGEQETGYIEGTTKGTPRKEINKAVPFECSDEHFDCQDEMWRPMIVATVDAKTQSQVTVKEGKQSSFFGERLHRGISKKEDEQRHGTVTTKKQSQVMTKAAKQSGFTGERIYRGISREEDEQRHEMIATNKPSQDIIKEAKLAGFTGERIQRGISKKEDIQRHEVICRKCKHDCVIQICDLTKDGFCDKKVEELRGCQRTYLIKKLDVERAGIGSWKELAQIVGVDNTTIDNWKGNYQAGGFSPTESLIHHMIAGNTLVSHLLNHLETIGRFDIRDALREHLENKCNLCRRTSCEAKHV